MKKRKDWFISTKIYVIIPTIMEHRSFLYWLAWNTWSKSYIKKNKIKVDNPLNIDLKKGPMLLLCNHCGIYDPVIISSVCPKLVKWVTGAYMFKRPGFHYLFKYILKSIPMQQGQSDLGAIRHIQNALKRGNIVGLFPEGTRTWDGDMVNFDRKPLAKMIRMFKVPVLFINLEGVYASQPRWADFYRTGGQMTVNIKALLSVEELSSMKVEDIIEYIEKNFSFSNDQWKTTVDYNFVSDKRAEGVQRLIYMCPKCGKLETIVGKGNIISCSNCGLSVELDKYDNVDLPEYGINNLAAWHRWEQSKIGEIKSFNKEKGILFQKSLFGKSRYKNISKDIDVSFNDDVLYIEYIEVGEKKALSFAKDSISSMILNAKQTIEFVVEDNIYRVRLLPSSNSLKYQEKILFS